MKQLATMDDINNIKNAMDSLLNRVSALEYTSIDLQHLITNQQRRIEQYQPYQPYGVNVPEVTYTLNDDGTVTWTTNTNT